MENLMNTSSDMLQAVSEFLGVTVEYFQANGQQLLIDYAWYSFVKDIPKMIIIFIFIYFVVVILQSLLIVALYDMFDVDLSAKTVVISFIVTAILSLTIYTITMVLPLIIAPEFVGLENIYNMIGGN